MLLFPVFLAATGVVLHFANRQSLEKAHTERLSAYIYNLLASAEYSETSGLWLPAQISEARFNQIQSGLIALVRNEAGGVLWSSISALGAELPENVNYSPKSLGEFVTGWTPSHDYLRVALTASFSAAESAPVFLFEVLQEKRLISQEARAFTATLKAGFFIVAGILLLLIVVLIYWLLKPLHHVTEELRQVEKGELDRISETYPHELSLLTRALNTVISAERKQRERYQNSLGDLAHSLKTPLAVMRGELDSLFAGDKLRTKSVQQQLTRIDDVVTYQLKRASSAAGRVWAKPVAVGVSLERLLEALARVYKNRGIVVESEIAPGIGFLGEDADFLEITGNLIENAFKYSDTTIRIVARVVHDKLELLIADDGPGIPVSQWEAAKKRGVRLDTRPIGQGIGLTVAADLVASYGGELSLVTNLACANERSTAHGNYLPGANLQVCLPGAMLSD